MEERPDLRSTLAATRRWAWIVLLAVAAGVTGAAVATHALPRTYEATTTLFVGSRLDSGEPGTEVAYAALAQTMVMSFRQLAETRSVALEAAGRAGVGEAEILGGIRADAEQGTQILRVSARFRSAADAAAVANAAGEVLLERVRTLTEGEGRQVGVEIIDAATAPSEPVSPRGALNLLLGGILGLFAGLGLAITVEALDARLRTPEDIERELDLPLLQAVPKWRRAIRKTPPAERHAVPFVAEPYRNLALVVANLAEREGHRKLLVTSAGMQEGKTTVAAHLGLALAEYGRPTALVEGDIHRPALARALALPAPGSIRGADPNSRDVRVGPNLTVFSSGHADGSMSAHLQDISSAIDAAATREAHVLIDAPPALAVSDTRALAWHADTVVLVVRSGRARPRDVRSCIAALKQIGVAVAGVVLTAAPRRPGESYAYYRAAAQTSRLIPFRQTRARAQ